MYISIKYSGDGKSFSIPTATISRSVEVGTTYPNHSDISVSTTLYGLPMEWKATPMVKTKPSYPKPEGDRSVFLGSRDHVGGIAYD